MADVILALDVPRPRDALALLDRLPEVRWVKVGSVLMTRAGAPLIQTLIDRGLRVFLDLKWHDIPNTVAGAVSAARELGVSMATVHTLGGDAMLAAAAAAAGPELGLVGVTVLTSHDAAEYGRAVGRTEVDVDMEVGRLAGIAIGAGVRGVVCSPHEVQELRRRLGREAWIVVPGIRRASDAAGDQRRTAAPEDAVRAGASHLVVGRAVLEAHDPVGVYREIVEAARCPAA